MSHSHSFSDTIFIMRKKDEMDTHDPGYVCVYAVYFKEVSPFGNWQTAFF